MGERIELPAPSPNRPPAMRAYLAMPRPDVERAPLSTPAVLVLHAWWGLNPDVERLCDKFASLGYVALAPDLYEGRTATAIGVATELRDALDRGRALAHLSAALDYLQRDTPVRVGRIGLLGLSLGGSMAFRLAASRPADVSALVTFYGMAADVDARLLRVAVQGHFAADDTFASRADVEALAQALSQTGFEAEIHNYRDAGHWFFEPSRADAYDESASRIAWFRTLQFLDRVLTSEAAGENRGLRP